MGVAPPPPPQPRVVIQTTTTTNVAWISSDCSESYSPLSNDVTEGVITTWSNRIQFRLQETFVDAGFVCRLSRRTNALCPLSKSQSLGKEGILDMARENAPFQQHASAYFAFRRLLRWSNDRTLPLVEKICDLMGFGRVDKVRTANCEEGSGRGDTIIAKQRLIRWIHSKKHRNT